jgi:hypothetical protein
MNPLPSRTNAAHCAKKASLRSGNAGSRVEPREGHALDRFPSSRIAKNLRQQRRQWGTPVSLPRLALMERFFLSILCASAALLVAAFVATNPIVVADSQSPQVPVLRLVQR